MSDKSLAEQLSPLKGKPSKARAKPNKRPLYNENYKKEVDGIDHINIYIQGKTELGRALSMEYEKRFVHPVLGPFNSLTNYWAYVKSKSRSNVYRVRNASSCLTALKRNKDMRDTVENFRAIIVRGCWYRVFGNPKLLELMKNSTLPFQMYYIKKEHESNGNLSVEYEVKVQHRYSWWLLNGFEEIRKALKEDRDPNMDTFMSNLDVPLYHDFATDWDAQDVNACNEEPSPSSDPDPVEETPLIDLEHVGLSDEETEGHEVGIINPL